MRWLMLALLFELVGCSSPNNQGKRIGPGMMEDSQDLRAGGYVN